MENLARTNMMDRGMLRNISGIEPNPYSPFKEENILRNYTNLFVMGLSSNSPPPPLYTPLIMECSCAAGYVNAKLNKTNEQNHPKYTVLKLTNRGRRLKFEEMDEF